MAQEILFRNFQNRENLKRFFKILVTSFRKLSIPFNIELEFSDILVKWNAPIISVATRIMSQACSQSVQEAFRLLLWFKSKNLLEIGLKFQSCHILSYPV